MKKYFLLLMLLAGTTLVGCQQATAPPPQKSFSPGQTLPAVTVQTETVGFSLVEESSTFLASLEAAERVEIRSEVAGRVIGVRVGSGQTVVSGQVLVELKNTSSEARLQAAKASAAAQQAAVQVAETQLAIARSRVTSELAEVELARTDYQRYADLAAEGAVPTREVDLLERDLRTAQERVRQAELEVVSAQASLNQANLLYDQARAQVVLEEESAATNQVASSIGGRIDEVRIGIGDVVTSDTLLATVVNNDYLDVHIAVPSSRASELREGLKVQVVDPKGKQALGSSQIQFVSPVALQQSQSVVASARLANPDKSLRDGQVVEATIVWSSGEVLTVPTTAISRVAGQAFVFIYNEETGFAEQRAVQLGNLQANRYQVVSGLAEGDSLIITGVARLRNNTPVVVE